MGSILTIYNVRTVNQKTQHVRNWAVITLRAECFWSLIILNEGLAGCSKEPSPIQSAAASALYSMGQEQCTSKPKNPFLIKTSAGYMEKNCAEQNIENLSHIHCSACTFIFPYPALSVQCLLALMYFRQGRKAACKHLRVQKLLYMFSDLNPGSVHPKCSSWKGKGKKEKKEKQKKKGKKQPCVVSFTAHSKTFKSAAAQRGNPIRIMLWLSLCRRSSVATWCLFMRLEQHHAVPPLRPPLPGTRRSIFREIISSELCACTQAH